MGLLCSGEISDFLFYQLAEKYFVLRDEIRLKYHIKFYARFKDDLFIVLGGSPESRKEFWHEFKTRSKYFKLKMESISNTEANVLDLCLFKGPLWRRTSRLDIKMFFKPTGLNIMLSDESAHHSRLHLSWPTCRFNSFLRKCTDTAGRTEAQKFFVSSLAQSCPGHCAVRKLRASIGLSSVLEDRVHAKLIKPRSWLVLPSFCQWTSSSCAGRLSQVYAKWLPILQEDLSPGFFHGNSEFRSEDASILSVGVSWSLPGRHFGQQIKSWNYAKRRNELNSS